MAAWIKVTTGFVRDTEMIEWIKVTTGFVRDIEIVEWIKVATGFVRDRVVEEWIKISVKDIVVDTLTFFGELHLEVGWMWGYMILS